MIHRGSPTRINMTGVPLDRFKCLKVIFWDTRISGGAQRVAAWRRASLLAIFEALGVRVPGNLQFNGILVLYMRRCLAAIPRPLHKVQSKVLHWLSGSTAWVSHPPLQCARHRLLPPYTLIVSSTSACQSVFLDLIIH